MNNESINDHKIRKNRSVIGTIGKSMSDLLHHGIHRGGDVPQRRLATVMYADVCNYTHLSETDEDGTHERLIRYMDLVSSRVRESNGRIVHYAGDAMLAEFHDVIGGLECAVTVQVMVDEINRDIPVDERIEFRIGINMGEIISRRDDIYGNVVNIAARLENLADAGAIAVSDAVRVNIGNRLPVTFISLGEQQLKHVNAPVRVFKVDFGCSDVASGSDSKIVHFPTERH